jgi:hypothetical protein
MSRQRQEQLLGCMAEQQQQQEQEQEQEQETAEQQARGIDDIMREAFGESTDEEEVANEPEGEEEHSSTTYRLL